MIRIRFHGRGGHGIKTASRIVGTAAFLAGMQAQDSPLYGAERRGAALVAFTRIAESPIHERGIVLGPDLILVADESLLSDPASGVLVGQEAASMLFVNSPKAEETLRGDFAITCPMVVKDLTGPTLNALGRGSALSAPLAAVACALTGKIPGEILENGLREELEEISLPESVIANNCKLAREVFASIGPVTIRARELSSSAVPLHPPRDMGTPAGVPVILNPGNSEQRHTGSWRIFRPIIDQSRCTRCRICLAHCPEGAITMDDQGYPVIDYDNCKGCMICRRECPIHCIEEQKEVAAW